METSTMIALVDAHLREFLVGPVFKSLRTLFWSSAWIFGTGAD